MKESHLQVFLLEANELLDEIEHTLLALEEDLNNSELISRAFRALHTLKGSGAMFGFDAIASFLHKIENVFDLIRNGELNLNSQIITLTLKSGDIIKKMLENQPIDENEIANINENFASFLNTGVSGEPSSSISESNIETNSNLKKYIIKFAPTETIFMSGTNPLLLIRELTELGESKIKAESSIPVLDQLDPTLCYVKWEIELVSERSINDIKDVFIFVEDDCILEISEEVIQTGIFENTINVKEDCEIVNDELAQTISKKTTAEVPKEVITSIRVNSDKLDELVNLVGELVIVQARLTQIAVKQNNLDLLSISEEVERLTWNLRDSTLNIRMLAIGTTFNKFKRLVRDLSMNLKKEVELVTNGGETEIDKTVIEKLNDPLIHIIRNSIDHGIESPEDRIKNGKSSVGEIKISAAQSGGYVYIKISDDGAGLDKNRILKKAIEKGLASWEKEYSDSEIYHFVFLPGFSTAASITSVSGRGVGMDVVKRSIETLRGTVEIDSNPGVGTVVTCKLPLTLAIIEGLLVRVSNEYFVIPLSQVEECVEYHTQKSFNRHGRSLIEIRGKLIPYISLNQVFELIPEYNPREQVVIIKDSEYKIGIKVDQIIGEQQVVIKSMGIVFKNVETISGATILGDGSVALILDVFNLIAKVEKSEQAYTNSTITY